MVSAVVVTTVQILAQSIQMSISVRLENTVHRVQSFRLLVQLEHMGQVKEPLTLLLVLLAHQVSSAMR